MVCVSTAYPESPARCTWKGTLGWLALDAEWARQLAPTSELMLMSWDWKDENDRRAQESIGQAANGGGSAVLASTGEHIAAPHADHCSRDAGGSKGGRMLFSSSKG